MNKEELLKLLELEMNEEQHFMPVFQRERNFFWGIISAIIAGIVTGLFKANNWEHYIYLLLAPILLFYITGYMKGSISRSSQRIAETIALRAKLESLLGFHTLNLGEKSPYWKNESLLIKRHREGRENFDTSEEFVKQVSNTGIFEIYYSFITTIRIMCLIVFLALLVLSAYHY